MITLQEKILAVVAIAYIFGMIVTFGHAAANTEKCENAEPFVAICHILTGSISSVTWPLYWSWELQEKEGE